MKRSLYRKGENKEEDERQQALVNIATTNDSLVFILRQLSLDMFKYHPWRLLRLMNTNNKNVLEAIQVHTGQNNFWYNMCIYSFPDIVMYLSIVRKQVNELETIKNDNLHNELYIMQRNHLFMQNDEMMHTDFDFIIQNKERKYTHLTRSSAYKYLDRSFTDKMLLDECMQNIDTARKTEKCFKLLYPCGIPPTEYCFYSQVKLYELTFQFLQLVYKIIGSNGFTKLYWKWLGLYSMVANKTYIEDISFIEIDTCKRFNEYLEDNNAPDGNNIITNTGSGPAQHDDGWEKNYNAGPMLTSPLFESVFSLDLLLSNVDKFMKNKEVQIKQDNSMDVMNTLRNKIVESICLFSDEKYDHLVRLKYHQLLNNGNKTGEKGNIERLLEDRSSNMKKYQTYDPLYINLFTQNDISVGNICTNDRWKSIVKNQIDIVKSYYEKNSEEYIRIESTYPNTSIKCMHETCINSDITSLSMDQDAPFNTYCNEECRYNHMFKK